MTNIYITFHVSCRCSNACTTWTMESNINLGHFYKNLQDYASTPCILFAEDRFIFVILFISICGQKVGLERGSLGTLRKRVM